MKNIVSIFIVALIGSNLLGQGKTSPSQLVTNIMKIYVESGECPPGVSIAMLRDGEIIYSKGFGYSDVEVKKRISKKTKFRAASVSKVMTATALAKLLQDKKLDLDLPIQTYVPEFPKKEYPITTRLIAGHLSGIPHYTIDDKIENKYYSSVGESLSVFSHLNLLFPPGEGFQYSSHGFVLLSAAVVGASGMPYLHFMDKEIFKPLRMKSTGPHLVKNETKNMTSLYTIDDNGLIEKVEKPEDPSYKWGSGGMISTPTDLVRLGNAYLSGFLKKEIVNMMFDGQILKNGDKSAVGIGWFNNVDVDGRLVYEHNGSMEGARSVLCIFPEENFVIAIMANASKPSRIEEMAHLLSSIYLEKTAPKKQPTIQDSIILKINENGNLSEFKGEIFLRANESKIIVNMSEDVFKTYKLIYLQRDNLYAVITLDGILFTKIDTKHNRIIGKSVRYGTARLTPPTWDDPYLSFCNRL